jgi:Cu/Ag efflux pump CusA
VIGVVLMLVVAAAMLYPGMGKEFLPTFNEGSATISFASAPGTSLQQSNEVGEKRRRTAVEDSRSEIRRPPRRTAPSGTTM